MLNLWRHFYTAHTRSVYIYIYTEMYNCGGGAITQAVTIRPPTTVQVLGSRPGQAMWDL
jgi:hypothetical protein